MSSDEYHFSSVYRSLVNVMFPFKIFFSYLFTLIISIFKMKKSVYNKTLNLLSYGMRKILHLLKMHFDLGGRLCQYLFPNYAIFRASLHPRVLNNQINVTNLWYDSLLVFAMLWSPQLNVTNRTNWTSILYFDWYCIVCDFMHKPLHAQYMTNRTNPTLILVIFYTFKVQLCFNLILCQGKSSQWKSV